MHGSQKRVGKSPLPREELSTTAAEGSEHPGEQAASQHGARQQRPAGNSRPCHGNFPQQLSPWGNNRVL